MATHPMEVRAIEEDNFRSLTLQAGLSVESVQRAFSGQEDPSQSVVNDGHLTFTNLPEEGYVAIGFAAFPENTTSQTQQSGSPSKDEFYYGGFMESPIDRNVDGSSPFGRYSVPFVFDCVDIVQLLTMSLLLHISRSQKQEGSEIVYFLVHLYLYPKTPQAHQSVIQQLVSLLE